jgi:general secretion pathway protein D
VGTNAPIVNAIDYRDIGIILKITPRVNSSGMVLLDIEQEVSDVVPTLTPGIASPTFSMRRIATSIAVKDGEVIALGGLISDSQTNGNGGIPFLNRIPVIGPTLFGNINNQGTKTELIVLLRPQVVRSVDEGKAVTDELKAKLQSLRSLLPADSLP